MGSCTWLNSNKESQQIFLCESPVVWISPELPCKCNVSE